MNAMKTSYELAQAEDGDLYGTRSGSWFLIPDSQTDDYSVAVVTASDLATRWNTPIAVFIFGSRYPETIVEPDSIR